MLVPETRWTGEESSMWHVCEPKSEADLKECSELGSSLNKLTQPTILAILADAGKPLHGYAIVQLAADSPMYGGKKPDATGIYRTLRKMQDAELLTSEWGESDEGPSKRSFDLTDKGRKALRRWIDALACYTLTIEEFRKTAAESLGIEVPDTPGCTG